VRQRVERQFWMGANGAFLDIAVLEWCKLFTEHKGKHHWKTIISDASNFRKGLHAKLGLSGGQFEKYAKTVLHYRDKFVAHLDDEVTVQYPIMWPARRSASYLYNYLLNDPALAIHIADFTHSAKEFYSLMYKHAYREYLVGGEA
jgi:hypothetical protein